MWILKRAWCFMTEHPWQTVYLWCPVQQAFRYESIDRCGRCGKVVGS